MNRPGLSGSFWPTPQEELLLRAALLDGEEVREAWETVRSSFAIDEHTGDSLRIMPMLHANLRKHGIDDPVLPRLAGMTRRSWYLNQTMLHHAGEALRILDAEGIDTMVLKGTALIERYYKDAGLREMRDVDILVPRRQGPGAMQTLERNGWVPAEPLTDKFLWVNHGMLLQNGKGKCDLHWRLLREFDPPGPDPSVPYWEASVPLTVSGIETRALCASDQLLHSILHGACWDSVHHNRWIADATVVVRSGDVDWSRFLKRAGAGIWAATLRDALSYLRESIRVAVPAEVVADLGRRRFAPRDRLVRRYVSSRPSAEGIAGGFPLAWSRYVRLTATWSVPRAALHFPRYLRVVYGSSAFRKVPAALSRWAGRPRRKPETVRGGDGI
ncbi:MAG: nucleotidyltransferase family protein [Actinomycetota bacterium]